MHSKLGRLPLTRNLLLTALIPLLSIVLIYQKLATELRCNQNNLTNARHILAASTPDEIYWRTILADSHFSVERNDGIAPTESDIGDPVAMACSSYLAGHAELERSRNTSAQHLFASDFRSETERSTLVFFFLGLAHLGANEPAQAVQSWRQAPDTAQLLLRIGGEELYKQNEPASAQPYFNFAAQVAPSLCEPRYRLAIAWNEMGEPEKALDALGSGPLSCPDTFFIGEIYYQRGRILANLGDLDAAVLEMWQTVALEETEIKYLVFLADLLVRKEDQFDAARQLFQQVIQIDPETMAAYTGLCNLERSQKNYEEALSWCQMAIDRFPEEAEPYFRTGRVYLEMSEFSEAIVWLVKALRYERTNENMWIRLAEAYEGTGNVEQALVAYQEALQLESDNAYVKRKLDELTR